MGGERGLTCTQPLRVRACSLPAVRRRPGVARSMPLSRGHRLQHRRHRAVSGNCGGSALQRWAGQQITRRTRRSSGKRILTSHAAVRSLPHLQRGQCARFLPHQPGSPSGVRLSLRSDVLVPSAHERLGMRRHSGCCAARFFVSGSVHHDEEPLWGRAHLCASPSAPSAAAAAGQQQRRASRRAPPSPQPLPAAARPSPPCARSRPQQARSARWRLAPPASRPIRQQRLGQGPRIILPHGHWLQRRCRTADGDREAGVVLLRLLLQLTPVPVLELQPQLHECTWHTALFVYSTDPHQAAGM